MIDDQYWVPPEHLKEFYELKKEIDRLDGRINNVIEHLNIIKEEEEQK